jgi:ATP-dependent DNA ligase
MAPSGFTKSSTTATASVWSALTRSGYNWTDRYPWIVEAARKIRRERFVIDGEAVILGLDGISDFDALHSGKHNEVQLCAFDLLVEGDDDLRKLPLHLRKTSLERLLARRPEGVFVNPFERGEIGPDLFRAACDMGLEGLVSKRRDRPYQAGRSKHWIKIKEPEASGDEPSNGSVRLVRQPYKIIHATDFRFDVCGRPKSGVLNAVKKKTAKGM